MALTNAQLLSLPGGAISVGAIKSGTGILISNGIISLNPTTTVLKITAGGGISISPTSGVGNVTVTYAPQLNSSVSPGDRMFFFNSTAPAGWTTVSTFNDLALRVVSGSGGGTGGTTGFSAAFTTYSPQGTQVGPTLSGSVASATVSTSQIASHQHSYEARECSPVGIDVQPGGSLSRCDQNTSDTGGNNSHDHAFASGTITGPITGTPRSFAVKYADCIICSKN